MGIGVAVTWRDVVRWVFGLFAFLLGVACLWSSWLLEPSVLLQALGVVVGCVLLWSGDVLMRGGVAS